MPDLATFHQKVSEYLSSHDLTQRELAIHIGMTHEELNRRLRGTGSTKITCVDVHAIVKGLAYLGAITTRQQAHFLLRLMECDNIDLVDWEAEPLSELKPDPPPSLNGQEEATLLRTNYLEHLLWFSRLLTLPIAPNHEYPLPDIFQPLKLLRKPFVAEDLPFAERRALLDEPSRGEYDPRRMWSEHEPENMPERGRDVSQPVIVDNLEEALKRSKGRALVLGPPGSGKTTVIKAFASDMAQQALAHASAMIPILIQLHRLTRTDYTLQSALRVMLGTLGVDERYAKILWHEIQRGRACLCIDGLDEVPAEQREMVIGWIKALAPEKGNHWIISSRFAAYQNGLFQRSQFFEWELQPLAPVMRHRLAKGLIPHVYQQMRGEVATERDVKRFLRALEKHPRVSTWSKNPLLVSLTAIVFAFTGTIPASRAALYQQVIDAVLQTRQQGRRIHLQWAASFLALRMFLKKRRTISYEMLLDLLAGHSSSLTSNEELAQGLIHAGLLEVVAKDTYGYWHSSYQEYFAAAELAKRLASENHMLREQTQELIDEQWTKDQWVEVLRLMLGILVDKYGWAGVQRALAWIHTRVDPYTERDQDDPGNLGLALAIQCLGERGATSVRWDDIEWKQLEDVAAQAWVAALLESVDQKSEGRQSRLANVAEELGYFNSSTLKKVRQQLMALLPHQSARMRATIIQVLGKLGRDASTTEVLLQALGDRHASVREAAVRALVEMGEDAPVDTLMKKDLKSEHPAVRVAAIQVLGELGQPDSVKHLLPELRHDEWSIREATVVALGNLGEPSTVKAVLKRVRDENSFVRRAAVVALGKLGGNDRHFLAVLRNDPDDSVRAEVLRVLGKRTPLQDVLMEVMCPPHFVPYSLAHREAARLLAEAEEQDVQFALSQLAVESEVDARAVVQEIREAQQEPSIEELIAYLNGTNKHLLKQGRWLTW